MCYAKFQHEWGIAKRVWRAKVPIETMLEWSVGIGNDADADDGDDNNKRDQTRRWRLFGEETQLKVIKVEREREKQNIMRMKNRNVHECASNRSFCYVCICVCCAIVLCRHQHLISRCSCSSNTFSSYSLSLSLSYFDTHNIFATKAFNEYNADKKWWSKWNGRISVSAYRKLLETNAIVFVLWILILWAYVCTLHVTSTVFQPV